MKPEELLHLRLHCGYLLTYVYVVYAILHVIAAILSDATLIAAIVFTQAVVLACFLRAEGQSESAELLGVVDVDGQFFRSALYGLLACWLGVNLKPSAEINFAWLIPLGLVASLIADEIRFIFLHWSRH